MIGTVRGCRPADPGLGRAAMSTVDAENTENTDATKQASARQNGAQDSARRTCPAGQRPAQRRSCARHRPDATTVAAMVSLCTYTWFLYGIGPSLPLFRDELGTSSAVAGLHSLMLAAGVVLAGFAGVGLGRRWRRYGVARRGVCC